MRYLLTVFCFSLLLSCQKAPINPLIEGLPKGTNFRINHHQQTCIGLGPSICFLVQEEDLLGSTEWQVFYSGIKGFTYEPGFIYNLKIKQKKIKNPPQDASSIEYILVKMLSKEKVAEETEFKIGLSRTLFNGDIESFVTEDSTTGLSILNTLKVDCQNLCDELTEKLQQQGTLIGVFQHGKSDEIILVDLETI